MRVDAKGYGLGNWQEHMWKKLRTHNNQNKGHIY
jgi:hypothetical protein